MVTKAEDTNQQHPITNMNDLDSLEERDIQIIVYQLVQALEFLNDFKYVIQNLKPNNVIIKSHNNFNVWITDYGFQCLFTQKKPIEVKQEDKKWMAPDRKMTSKSDIWSVGAIAFWLVTKEEPSETPTASSVASDLQKLNESSMSDDCKDFIKKAFVYDVNQRADIGKLKEHKWISSIHQELNPKKNLK